MVMTCMTSQSAAKVQNISYDEAADDEDNDCQTPPRPKKNKGTSVSIMQFDLESILSVIQFQVIPIGKLCLSVSYNIIASTL